MQTKSMSFHFKRQHVPEESSRAEDEGEDAVDDDDVIQEPDADGWSCGHGLFKYKKLLTILNVDNLSELFSFYQYFRFLEYFQLTDIYILLWLTDWKILTSPSNGGIMNTHLNSVRTRDSSRLSLQPDGDLTVVVRVVEDDHDVKLEASWTWKYSTRFTNTKLTALWVLGLLGSIPHHLDRKSVV